MSTHLEKLILFLDDLVLQLLSLVGLNNDKLISQIDNIDCRCNHNFSVQLLQLTYTELNFLRSVPFPFFDLETKPVTDKISNIQRTATYNDIGASIISISLSETSTFLLNNYITVSWLVHVIKQEKNRHTFYCQLHCQ
jgi:hypothetical protein